MSVRRLSIPARYAEVASACAFCSDAATAAGLSEDAAFHVQIAVDEACTNIIEHAYGGESDDGKIELICRIAPEELTITLRDSGKAFNPEDVPPPRLGPCLAEDLEAGGLGLYFMRQVMDEVRFRFGGQGNELIMVKRGHRAGA